MVLEKTLQSSLDCKEIQLVHPKGNQSWIFIGRTDTEAQTPILWPPDVKNWFIWKDPDAGKDWRQEEKGMTEDEMVGWHHRHDGREFEQAPGVSDGQGGLVCCGPWGQTRLSDWTELRYFREKLKQRIWGRGSVPGRPYGVLLGYKMILVIRFCYLPQTQAPWRHTAARSVLHCRAGSTRCPGQVYYPKSKGWSGIAWVVKSLKVSFPIAAFQWVRMWQLSGVQMKNPPGLQISISRDSACFQFWTWLCVNLRISSFPTASRQEDFLLPFQVGSFKWVRCWYIVDLCADGLGVGF